MDTSNNVVTVRPPRLIPSFLSGFNTIANHIQLILLPILLDLFFWFGPKLQLKDILNSINQDFTRSMVEYGTQEMMDMVRANQELMQQAMNRFNLLSSLRTLPVGIFSLLADLGPLHNPLGWPLSLEVPNILSAIFLWFVFSIMGLVLGAFYFSEVARFCKEITERFSLKRIGSQFLQTLLLMIGLIILLIAISIPTAIMVTILALISPDIAQIGMLVIIFFLLWLAFPLFFSSHGIFFSESGVLKSVVTSARLVRYTLPSTGLFMISLYLFSQVFNLLWTSAPETSWMLLVGIVGHAFTSTGLLAASFLYYRDGLKWVEQVNQEIIAKKIKTINQ